jgi:hypothetical protein
MVPRTDIELALDDPGGVAGYPTVADLWSDTFDGNRLYDPSFLEATWDEVRDAIEIEDDLIARADADSDTADEFDTILDEDVEDWQELALGMLDVGVASAVLALSASGCATSSSCRGHHTQHPSEFAVPEVVFWTNADRAVVVREAAATVGCAFGVGDEGRASVWAPSVVEMLALAKELLARRSTFDLLDPPPYR